MALAKNPSISQRLIPFRGENWFVLRNRFTDFQNKLSMV